MPIKTEDQAVSILFPKGTILWRQTSFNSPTGKLTYCQIQECPFAATGRGSWIAKVTLFGGFINEPEVIPHRVMGKQTRGISVFLMDKPPENWTHLSVTGCSKDLRRKTGDGGAIFARVEHPLDMEEYENFRLRMFTQVSENLNCDFQQKLLIASCLGPNQHYIYNLQRLVVDPKDKRNIEYTHIKEVVLCGKE